MFGLYRSSTNAPTTWCSIFVVGITEATMQTRHTGLHLRNFYAAVFHALGDTVSLILGVLRVMTLYKSTTEKTTAVTSYSSLTLNIVKPVLLRRLIQ
ncbi:hypothetical protein PsYK624_044500 [Phanerochaete sordida]|uniref:Uncharacterized protein n=1 Tax=Phanerochaete sordida TaxID=48140 RepID=A0A9P3G5B2_9APHY|nr:hypothetical protein PsYK624_044500 [Phanerochaete sordida]